MLGRESWEDPLDLAADYVAIPALLSGLILPHPGFSPSLQFCLPSDHPNLRKPPYHLGEMNPAWCSLEASPLLLLSCADWCWCHHRYSIFTTGGKVFYSTHKTTVVGAVHFHQHCPGLGLGHMRLIPDRNIGICIWDLLKSTTAYHFICPEVL